MVATLLPLLFLDGCSAGKLPAGDSATRPNLANGVQLETETFGWLANLGLAAAGTWYDDPHLADVGAWVDLATGEVSQVYSVTLTTEGEDLLCAGEAPFGCQTYGSTEYAEIADWRLDSPELCSMLTADGFSPDPSDPLYAEVATVAFFRAYSGPADVGTDLHLPGGLADDEAGFFVYSGETAEVYASVDVVSGEVWYQAW